MCLQHWEWPFQQVSALGRYDALAACHLWLLSFLLKLQALVAAAKCHEGCKHRGEHQKSIMYENHKPGRCSQLLPSLGHMHVAQHISKLRYHIQPVCCSHAAGLYIEYIRLLEYHLSHIHFILNNNKHANVNQSHGCLCEQVALGWPLEDFPSAATAALEAGSVELSSLQKLAHARQAQLSTPSS